MDLPSPISPTKKALSGFLKKKEEELKRLNERLDFYIKKVKTLEKTNNELTAEKNILEESNKKLTAEVTVWKITKDTEIKQFQSRLEETNRLYDEMLKERARLHNENRKNATLADEYKKKLDKENAEHKKTENAWKTAKRKLSEREEQLVARSQEIRNLETILLELKKECQELKDALETANYSLEQETLLKMDLERKLLAMKAELVSIKEKHEKDVVEIRSQLRIAEAKLFQVESEMKSRYEDMLAEQLQKQRNELETRYSSEYDELQQKYLTAVAELTTVQDEKSTWSLTVESLRLDLSQWQAKCDELQKMYAKDWEELSNVREENRNLTIHIENLKLQKGQLQSKNASLVLKIEDLEKVQEADKSRAAETIAKKDAFIKERNHWIITNHEYDEKLMMEVKQALDVDINKYRRMIEDEEERLNINRRKRRRIDFEGTASIQIEEASIDGKFVRLFNSGSRDFPLGGWSLERSVDGEPPVIYKFTSKYVLKTGSSVTIWASKGGGQHKPPTDLIFKQKASWGVGKETKTVLRNSDGQEAASEAHEEVVDGDERTPGLKRMQRRVEVYEQGRVQIEEANIDGKFVKLFNSGSKDFPLGGWSLERSVDGEPPVTYKFTSKYVLKTGSYVTIWASKAGGQHKPPTDLIFKQKASWGVGKETKTVLRDPDGQEAASEVYEEVTIIRTDESATQKEPILISEEGSGGGTDEVVSQAVTIEPETDGEPPRPVCTIQ